MAENHNLFFNKKQILLGLVLLSLVFFLIEGVSATHDTQVTIDPSVANCNQLGNTFTVTIKNTGNGDSILQVELYKALAGISNFECGDAPSGWTLYSFTDRCIYVTELNSDDKIGPGETLNFTFDAAMSSDSCTSNFVVVTTDDAEPQGDRVTKQVTVDIDCSIPDIDKTVGTPKIHGQGFDWWITQNTNINIFATDDSNECDLGMDYCRWRYRLDDGSWGEWEIHNANINSEVDFDFSFNEDSKHDIQIECYDKAGNKKTLNETDKVDSTPPETTKAYGDPHFPDDINDGAPYPHWITTHTPITFESKDGGQICAIGVEKMWYYDQLVPDSFCENEPSDGDGLVFYTTAMTQQQPTYCSSACPSPYSVMYHDDVLNKDVPCAEFAQTMCDNLDIDGSNFSSWEECVEYFANECIANAGYNCDSEWKLYRGEPVFKNEESCHVIQFTSSDELGNAEPMKYQCVYVDDTPPEGIKTLDGPNVSCGEGEDCDYWVQDHNTRIGLDCVDQQPHPVRNEKACYQVFLDGEDVTQQYCDNTQQSPGTGNNGKMEGGWCCADVSGGLAYWLTFTEDSNHTLKYYCEDGLGNKNNVDVEKFRVDSQPPIITKTMIGDEHLGECPPKDENDKCYVRDHDQNGVHIDVSDNDTYGCVVNHVTCTYSVNWKSTIDECQEANGLEWGDGWCLLEEGTFGEEGKDIIFHEDSTHKLTVNCEDALGNSARDEEDFLVDSTPPTTTKTYDESKSVVKGNYRWILPDTEITLNASDEKVGVDKLYYRVTNVGYDVCPEDCTAYDGFGDFIEVNGNSTIFNISEESCHLIEFYSVDKLGNTEQVNSQCVMVDDSTPVIQKKIGEPKVYDCSTDLKNHGFETGDLSKWTIESNADSVEVISGDSYLIPLEGDYMVRLGDDNGGIDGEQPIGENSISQTFTVENPIVSFAYNIFTFDYTGYNHFSYKLIRVNDSSVIYEYDQGAWGNSEGLKSTGWKFVNLDVSDYIGQELKLIISSGGTEDTSYSTWTYVDYLCDKTYISQNTPITLKCKDSLPHPVGDVTIWYRYKVSENCGDLENAGWVDPSTYCNEDYEGDWCDSACNDLTQKTIYFPEDSCHELEYFCEDALGNTGEIQSEIDVVDSQAPLINKQIVGPQWGDCPPQQGDDECYIDSATNITIDPVDPEPHPVGNVSCYWWYYVYDDEHSDGERFPAKGVYSTFPIKFPEESKHELHIKCKDALDNEAEDVETFFVDKTPPGIDKWYGEPYQSYDFENYSAEWINSDTPIHIQVSDDGPHKTGIKEVKYRITKVDDELCKYYYDEQRPTDYSCDDEEGSGQWKIIPEENYSDFVFNIPETSCHLIEIEAKDNVDKCRLHKQWVYVDNEAPEPNKIVGEPKVPWDGKDAEFYNLTDFCTEQGKCWKVTTMTPITLDCIDQQPHPVEHEKVYFRVELDGDDYTKEYCNKINGGEYNESGDGYCYVSKEEAPIIFYFTEESEHNLAYYCEDALGNKGPIDDEKFKVTGTSFNITLNKKWNLISVPVRLLDDSMDTVFKDIADDVKAVWSYDAETGDWHVYTPDGNSGNDDLTTMKPGDGYWVLANKDTRLVIGGSLMTPAMTPPSKKIMPGWNLVGYYGTEGLSEYNGPAGNGRSATCVFNSLGIDIWDKSFTSLWSYWEPYNPNSWLEFNRWDNLDPGAGYWLSSPQQGIYTPSTTCDWGP